MNELPECPKCESSYVYEDGSLLICPECAHEWAKDSASAADAADIKIIRDANGAELKDGDTVTVIKDLKFRGGVVKVGTKVKSIRLIADAADGHDVDCKIPGIGQMGLKSVFVKKVAG